MNYYISDLHLFHKNVTDEGKNFDHRPFKTLDEMHQTIKERWNTKITGTDHVYILGDMCWKEDERAISFVANLKGNKHLILGNHDRIKDHRFRQLFSEINRTGTKRGESACNHLSIGRFACAGRNLSQPNTYTVAAYLREYRTRSDRSVKALRYQPIGRLYHLRTQQLGGLPLHPTTP